MKESLEFASTSKDIKVEVDYEDEDIDDDSDSNMGNLVISNDGNTITSSSSQTSAAINNMKNAGRKKSNQVWEFFTDLREKGMPGVRCRFCGFCTEDRSPTTLKFHVKRFHDTGKGGLWYLLHEKYKWAGPHKYKARNLAANSPEFNESSTPNMLLENSFNAQSFLNSLSNSQIDWQQEDSIPSSQFNDLSSFNSCYNLFGVKTEVDETEDSNNGFGNDKSISTSPPLSAIEAPISDVVSTEDSLPQKENNDLNLLVKAESTPYYTNLLPNDPSLPAQSRYANPWRHIGTFNNEEDMHIARNKEKCSKRRTEQLKNGLKIRYRCNTWKRTKCAFQMYAFFANDKIDLYQTGVHDHSGDKMVAHLQKLQEKGVSTAPANAILQPINPGLSQEDILSSLVKQATGESTKEIITIHAITNNNNNNIEHDHSNRIEDEPPKKIPKIEPKEENPTEQLLNILNCKFAMEEAEIKTTDLNETNKTIESGIVSSSPNHQNSEDIKKPTTTIWPPIGATPKTTLSDNGDSNFIKMAKSLEKCKMPKEFSMQNLSKINALSRMTTELNMGLTMTNKENGLEYLITPNPSQESCSTIFQNPTNWSLSISEQKDIVIIKEFVDEKFLNDRWKKADWDQLLWAIRGKCLQQIVNGSRSSKCLKCGTSTTPILPPPPVKPQNNNNNNKLPKKKNGQKTNCNTVSLSALNSLPLNSTPMELELATGGVAGYRSHVWNHIERLSCGRMRCSICKDILSSINTCNAKRHMRNNHLSEYEVVMREDQKNLSNARSTTPSRTKV